MTCSQTFSRRRMTLLEIMVALGLFVALAMGLFAIYISDFRLSQASEEEASTTAAMRTELARVHNLEIAGGAGLTGIDAVIWHYLRNPDFTIDRTVPTGGAAESGLVLIQTDLDDDGTFETLLDADQDGLGATEETSGTGLSYDAARLRYGASVIRVSLRATYRSSTGGTTTRVHNVVLTRKEGHS